jgi:hypothetical protein
MAQSFADVVDQLNTNNEFTLDIAANTEATGQALENVSSTFTTDIDRLIEFMSGDSMDQLENRREQTVQQEQMLAALESLSEKMETRREQEEETEGSFSDLLENVTNLGLVMGPVAVTLGSITGVLRGYVDSLRAIGSSLSRMVSFMTRGVVNLEKTFSGIINTFRGFGARVASVLSPRGLMSSLTPTIQRLTGFFQSIGARLTSAVNSVRTVLQPVVNVFSSAISQFTSIFRTATSSFSGIASSMTNFGRTVGSVSRVVGRLFAPLNIIFIGFQTIRESIEGFKEGGILGGLQGAITGFLNGLVGIPLDLLKSAAAWIADKLGMESVAKALRSFSFTNVISDIVSAPFDLLKSAKDFVLSQLGFNGEGIPSPTTIVTGIITAPLDLLRSSVSWILSKLGFENLSESLSSFSFAEFYRSIVDSIFGLFTSAKDFLVDAFKGFSPGDMLSGALNAAENFIKSILRSVLPDPAKDYGLLDPRGYVAKAIPDSVYEFAGLNPDTGEVLETPETPSGNVQSGSALQREGEALRDSQVQAQVGARGTQGGGGDTNVSTNVMNSSNTTFQQRPPASSVPDNASDTMMSAYGMNP